MKREGEREREREAKAKRATPGGVEFFYWCRLCRLVFSLRLCLMRCRVSHLHFLQLGSMLTTSVSTLERESKASERGATQGERERESARLLMEKLCFFFSPCWPPIFS